MSITAELADGRKLEFPDGTSPDIIQQTVKKQLAGGAPKETEAPSFGTGTLYKMAHDTEQKKKVLENEYGAGNVQTDPKTGELYAEKDGKRIAPGQEGFWKGAAESALASAAPVAGQIAGEALGAAGGGVLGSVAGPAGTAAGGVAGFVAGGGAGTAAGETVNNLILKYASHAPTEHMAKDAWEGAESGAIWSAAGGAVFKGTPWLYNMAKEAAFARAPSVSAAYSKFRDFSAELEKAKQKAGGKVDPATAIQFVKDFFGVDEGALAGAAGAVGRAEALGTKLYTNPATYTKQSPALGQLEALASKFGVSKVLDSTRAYAERTGEKVSAKLGEISEVGKSVFGREVDPERLGRSLKIGAQEKFEKAMAELRKGQELAEKDWVSRKTALESSVKTFSENRDNYFKESLSHLAAMQRDALRVAGHVGESADQSARAQFGQFSKALAQEAEGVKKAMGDAHGAVLDAAYAATDSEPRVVSGELIDTLKGLINNALPSENASVREILSGMLPKSLKTLASAQGEEQTAKAATYAGVATGPEITLPRAPMMATLREMNTLKQELGRQAHDIFGKIAADSKEGLQKRLFKEVQSFVHATGDDVPKAWKTAAGEIAKSNKKYEDMMHEIDSKLISPFLLEAKAGAATERDLDAVARDVFSGNHPKDMLAKLFEKYTPQNRKLLVGADMFNVFKDAVESTGLRAQGLPPINPLKAAAAFAQRDLNGLLEHYGDPKLVSSIREFVRAATAFGLEDGKSLPTALVPSRTMQETVEGLTRSMKALEAHIKTDPAAVFKERFTDLERQAKGSPVGRFQFLHDAELGKAAETMMSHPAYVREIEQQFKRESPQFKLLVDTFHQKLLSQGIETDKKLVEYPRFLREQNVHPEVAKMLSQEGSAEMLLQLGQDLRQGLDKATDAFMSLYSGAQVAHPHGPVEAILHRVPVVGPAAKMLGRTIDRALLSKVITVASTAIEHPSMIKLLHGGAEMSPAARSEMIKDWIADVTVEIPRVGYTLANWIKRVFPGAITQETVDSFQVKAPLARTLVKALTKGAEVGYHFEPSRERQDNAETRTRYAGRAQSVLQTLGVK